VTVTFAFVEELTKTNDGCAYCSSFNNLGELVFVDYIRIEKETHLPLRAASNILIFFVD